MRVPELGSPHPPGRHGRMGSSRLPPPQQAGRGVPGAAALPGLSGPASPSPPRWLLRACQLGPNLISVLSVRTPLKPNSADYQQLSCHATPLPPRTARRREERGPAAPGAQSPCDPAPDSPGPAPGPGALLPCRVTGPFLRKQWDRRKLRSGGVGHTEVTKSRLPRPAGIPWTGDCRPPVSAWAVPSTGSSLPPSGS